MRNNQEINKTLLEACQESLGVLTEPGMMDVDEWKAWSKKTVMLLKKAISAAIATDKGE